MGFVTNADQVTSLWNSRGYARRRRKVQNPTRALPTKSMEEGSGTAVSCEVTVSVACDPAAKVTVVLLNNVVGPVRSKNAGAETDVPLGALTAIVFVVVPPAPTMPEKFVAKSEGDDRFETDNVDVSMPGPDAMKFVSVARMVIVSVASEVLVSWMTPVENSVLSLTFAPKTPRMPVVFTRPNAGPDPPLVNTAEPYGPVTSMFTRSARTTPAKAKANRIEKARSFVFIN